LAGLSPKLSGGGKQGRDRRPPAAIARLSFWGLWSFSLRGSIKFPNTFGASHNDVRCEPYKQAMLDYPDHAV
jgi:hypothetical protein